MPNPVVHFEITGGTGTELHDFYRELFGWDIKADNPMNYGSVSFGGGGGLTGAISPQYMGLTNLVTVYVLVPDLAEHLSKAESLGGKTVVPPTDIPGGGSFAHFTDPAGNRIGLWKG